MICAPTDAPQWEKDLHNFLDEIDVQYINVLEQNRAEEQECMLSSTKIKKSFTKLRTLRDQNNGSLWEKR